MLIRCYLNQFMQILQANKKEKVYPNHMEPTAINLISRGLVVYGLLLSAFLLSSFLQIKELADIRQYAASIFSTNCSFLFDSPQTCTQISTLLLVLPIVSALLIALFYRTFTMIFTSISLIVFAIFFCNPQIDTSFTSFIHFIQVCICVSGLMFLALKPNQKKLNN